MSDQAESQKRHIRGGKKWKRPVPEYSPDVNEAGPVSDAVPRSEIDGLQNTPDVQASLDNVTRKLASAEATVAWYREESKTAKEAFVDSEDFIHDLHAEAEQLQKRISDLEEQLSTKTAAHKALETVISNLPNSVTCESGQLRDPSTPSANSVNRELVKIHDLETEAKQLQKRISALEEQLRTKTAAHKALETLFNKLPNPVISRQPGKPPIPSLVNINRQLVHRLVTRSTEVSKLMERSTKADAMAQGLQDQVQKLEDKMLQKDAKMVEMQRELELYKKFG